LAQQHLSETQLLLYLRGPKLRLFLATPLWKFWWLGRLLRRLGRLLRSLQLVLILFIRRRR
jgi:hypothetical protein